MVAAYQAGGLLGRGGAKMALVGGVEQMSCVPIGLTDAAAAREAAAAVSSPAGNPRAAVVNHPG
jgi:acetyl-CoA acetyltransferase